VKVLGVIYTSPSARIKVQNNPGKFFENFMPPNFYYKKRPSGSPKKETGLILVCQVFRHESPVAEIHTYVCIFNLANNIRVET
jgi:hypothetical protein